MGILGRFTGSSRDRFAAEALRIVRRVAEVTDARYDREKFALAVWSPGEHGPLWIYLSNTYAECRDLPPRERRERIERTMRIMSTSRGEETWESARPRLRPVLRPVTFGHAGPEGMVPPLSRPAMPHLRELVVVDLPESMAYVAPPRLAAWGVSADEVFQVARDNLGRLARASLRQDWPDRDALVRMVDTGDGYFTSLLLAPDWLAGVSERMGAPVIAFVPDTNTVVLCGDSGGGLGPVYEMVEDEYREAIRGISPVGYVSGADGRVVPYAPPPGHPDHVPARRAAVMLAVYEYTVQTQWLTRRYEEAGIDVFVAGLLAAGKPGAPATTVTTWTDGITSLLPEAQFISFVGPGGTGPMVPWRAVADRVGLEAEPLLAPARYRVGHWPGPDVMRDLADQAVG